MATRSQSGEQQGEQRETPSAAPPQIPYRLVVREGPGQSMTAEEMRAWLALEDN